MRMSKLLLALVFVVLPITVVLAHPFPEGTWTTIDDKTGKKRLVVQLVIQDGVLTGTIEKVFPQPGDTGVCSKCPGAFKDKPAKGLQFVWGLRETSPGAWDGGQILDAKSGKIYNVKMTLKGNKLYVRGYVGISMLGRTQLWERDGETL